DVEPPVVTITSPSSSEGEDYTVTGTADDGDGTGVDTVEVRLNGGSWQTATGTTSWSLAVTLDPGANTVEARATDLVGNVSAPVALEVYRTVVKRARAIGTHKIRLQAVTDWHAGALEL